MSRDRDRSTFLEAQVARRHAPAAGRSHRARRRPGRMRPGCDAVAERTARVAVRRAAATPVPSARPPRPPRPARSPLGTVRFALDWTPNTNHTGFYVARRRAGTATPASTSRSCRTARTTPEALMRRRPGRLRDQLPGLAHLRRRGRRADRLGDGHPPAHRPGDRRPRVVRHHPPARPRRQDLRRLRLPATRSRP